MPPEAVTPIAPPPSRAQPPPQRELRPHPTQPIKVDDSDSDSDTIARDKNNWYQRLLQVIFLLVFYCLYHVRFSNKLEVVNQIWSVTTD